MILSRHLKGAMRLDRSKDMSVHVSTCTSYDLNELMPASWKVWRCGVFLCLVAKMSDRFLEKRINIIFCVKLGKNARHLCTAVQGL